MNGLYGDAIHAGDTSREAAFSMLPHTSRMETLILEHLQIFGPQTCDALEVALGFTHQGCSPRLTALRNRDLVYDSGLRRKTRSGRQAAVWALR